MKKWTKEQAIEELDNYIAQLANVGTSKRNSTVHARWLANTLRILEEIFGASSRYYLSMSAFSWSSSKPMFIREPWNALYEIEQNH